MNHEPSARRLELTLSGEVQGVSFRRQTQQKAEELGLVGLVRNNRDGSVTIIAEGEQATLKTLHDWAKTGPSRAVVIDHAVAWLDATGDFADFRIAI